MEDVQEEKPQRVCSELPQCHRRRGETQVTSRGKIGVGYMENDIHEVAR